MHSGFRTAKSNQRRHESRKQRAYQRGSIEKEKEEGEGIGVTEIDERGVRESEEIEVREMIRPCRQQEKQEWKRENRLAIGIRKSTRRSTQTAASTAITRAIQMATATAVPGGPAKMADKTNSALIPGLNQ